MNKTYQDDDVEDDESDGVHARKYWNLLNGGDDDDSGDYSVQSVPGTGDKEDKEDKGMTIEEKKEAERQR